MIYAATARRFAKVEAVLAAVGEGAHVPRAQRIRIWHEMMDLIGERAQLSTLEAKRAQLEAAGGRPLTFCFGQICRVPELKSLVDAEIVWGDGCGVVFVDSVTTSRPVFARYCKACRKGKRKRRRALIDRLTATVWDERVEVAYGWRITCRGCRERFFSPTAQRRRCDRCSHARPSHFCRLSLR